MTKRTKKTQMYDPVLKSGRKPLPMDRYLVHEQVQSWRLLMRAFQNVFCLLEAGLASEGYSVSRFQIFFHLYFEGPLQASELAKRLFVTRGNISTFTKRLIAEELIEILIDRKLSKRPRYLLTNKGVHVFERLFPRHIQRVRKIVPSFSQAALRELRKVAEA